MTLYNNRYEQVWDLVLRPSECAVFLRTSGKEPCSVPRLDLAGH